MSKIAKQTVQSPSIGSKTGESSTTETESGREMMQAVLSRPRTSGKTEETTAKRINGVVIGELSEPEQDGQAMVNYPGSPSGESMAAISTESMAGKTTGSAVALGFVEGNPERPIILGLIQQAGVKDQGHKEIDTSAQKVNVRLDGETMTLSADKEIILKCGKSSITLTRAGKIIVKGAYLSNHSTGVNRIKGGSVQIN